MQIIPTIYYCRHEIIKNLCQECKFIRGRICEHLFESGNCLLCNDIGFLSDESIDISIEISISEETSDSSMSEETSDSSMSEKSSGNSTSEESDEYILYPTKASNHGRMCQHGKHKSLCKKCKKMGIGGGSICEHLKKRSICLKCKKNGTGGGSYCDHDKLRSRCVECKLLGVGGRQLCFHHFFRAHCPQCR